MGYGFKEVGSGSSHLEINSILLSKNLSEESKEQSSLMVTSSSRSLGSYLENSVGRTGCRRADPPCLSWVSRCDTCATTEVAGDLGCGRADRCGLREAESTSEEVGWEGKLLLLVFYCQERETPDSQNQVLVPSSA